VFLESRQFKYKLTRVGNNRINTSAISTSEFIWVGERSHLWISPTMFVDKGFALTLVLTVARTRVLENRAISNSESSLTLIYQNNLNASDDVNHVSAILLDSMNENSAQKACTMLNEELLSKEIIEIHQQDFEYSLAYNAYAGRAQPVQKYIIEDGIVVASLGGHLSFETFSSLGTNLPVLCTQSSNASQPGTSSATPSNEVTVSAAGNNYVGFRNLKSFRFLGIRFADPPARFEYSQLFSQEGQTIEAFTYGSECAQGTSGSEDCLFLNINTPYIPKAGEGNPELRPVYFWIYGGGFTSGSSSDPSTDGGNIASREDIVSVTINYRLSTPGFLAVPGTNVKGNFGIGDQITALEVSEIQYDQAVELIFSGSGQ
jgi:hypothetical protein